MVQVPHVAQKKADTVASSGDEGSDKENEKVGEHSLATKERTGHILLPQV